MYQNYGWQTEGKMPTRLSSGAQCCGFQPNNCCELQRVISREKAKSLLQHLVLLKLIPARIADTVITKYSSMRDVVGSLMLQLYLLWMNFIST